MTSGGTAPTRSSPSAPVPATSTRWAGPGNTWRTSFGIRAGSSSMSNRWAMISSPSVSRGTARSPLPARLAVYSLWGGRLNSVTRDVVRFRCNRGGLAMTEPPGYALETLWEDEEFVLSRGVRDGEPAPLLAVAPASAQPAPGSLARLEHAHALRDELDPAWAARPSSLVRHRGRPTLLLEDPGGEPLARLLGRPWEVTSFLRVAIGLAAALGRLHGRGLIHKDVKPAHVLVDAATGAAWLIGFGIASRLPREHQAPEPPEVIAGTLAYMAPEQTGRMNRSVDSRSDLYALGVTYYEMLTGALPFTAADPMGWVYCHIARRPTPPGERAEGIPGPLSAVVMKLLAKTAEDRYQTAVGLAFDLRRCMADWESFGRIDAFSLGTQDASDRLLIPEKLYGRQREIDTLVTAFDRVMST